MHLPEAGAALLEEARAASAGRAGRTLGSVLHGRVSAPEFTRLVHGLIVVLGLLLLVR